MSWESSPKQLNKDLKESSKSTLLRYLNPKVRDPSPTLSDFSDNTKKPNTSVINKKTGRKTWEFLYEESKVKRDKSAKRMEEEKIRREEKHREACTFSPNISSMSR